MAQGKEIGATSWIFKRYGSWYNAATQEYLTEKQARRYSIFYGKHNWKIPFRVAGGGRSSLKESCLAQQSKRMHAVANSPYGPVAVHYYPTKDKFVYRALSMEFGGKRRKKYKPVPYKVHSLKEFDEYFEQRKKIKGVTGQKRPRKPKEPQVQPQDVVIGPTPPPDVEPDVTETEDIGGGGVPMEGPSPENDTLKFGHAVEKMLRSYAVMDLKEHPNKFGNKNEITYPEMYPSQQDLYNAMKNMMHKGDLSLTHGKGQSGLTKERVNVIASFLGIPTYQAKQKYFSEAVVVRRFKRGDTSGFQVYSKENLSGDHGDE